MLSPTDPVDQVVAALTKRRLLLGLPQVGVAVDCGVSQATLSRIEEGMSDPTLRVLLDYADAVRIDLLSLMRDVWAR